MAWFRRQGFSSIPFGVAQVIELSGTPVEMTLRRSQRARRLRLKVSDGKLEVVVPLRVSREEAHRLVMTHQDWIVKHALSQETATDEHSVYFNGKSLEVRLVEAGKSGILISDGVMTVYGSDPSQQLENWLMQRASSAVNESIERRTKEMSLFPKRVQLRDQKTKWGACTSRGTVTFNWRLIMAPPEVLDYVVVHELAHLRELNHSARFWSIVERHCPSHKLHKKWLKDHGKNLRLPRSW